MNKMCGQKNVDWQENLANNENVHKILSFGRRRGCLFLLKTRMVRITGRHVFSFAHMGAGGPRFPLVSLRRYLRKSIIWNPIRPMF